MAKVTMSVIKEHRCEVCGEFSKKNETLIGLVGCLHVYCKRCADMYFVRGVRCWKCSLQVDLEAFDSAPTYWKFPKENPKDLPTETILESQLALLKKDFKNIQNFLGLNFRVISDYLASVKSNLEEIENLTSNLEDATISKFRTLSDGYEVLRDRIHMRYGLPLAFTNLPVHQFSRKQEYLYTIHRMLQSGEDVYAVHRIADKLTYAKLSVQETKMYMHHFQYLEVPSNATVISFEEFKQLICKEKTLQTFIRIYSIDITQMIIIILDMNISKNSSRFIKFCSGEFGISFKSPASNIQSIENSCPDRTTLISRNENLQCILKIFNNCIGKKLPYDYNNDNLDEDAQVQYKENDIIAQLCPDGTIGLFRVLVEQNYPAIGKVSSPTDLFCLFPKINLHRIKPQKLYDCGLLITVV